MDGRMDAVEVLGSRILLHPPELQRSHRFYRDQLGLAIYREIGSRDAPGPVLFLGNGFWKSADGPLISLETRWRSGSRSVTCKANIGGC
jgi:hypothetical protein